MDGVKPRDRAIFLKKFGIGLPRPMLPKEIADQEGLSIARISQIFQTVVEQIQQNQVKYDVDPNILFGAVKKFRWLLFKYENYNEHHEGAQDFVIRIYYRS